MYNKYLLLFSEYPISGPIELTLRTSHLCSIYGLNLIHLRLLLQYQYLPLSSSIMKTKIWMYNNVVSATSAFSPRYRFARSGFWPRAGQAGQGRLGGADLGSCSLCNPGEIYLNPPDQNFMLPAWGWLWNCNLHLSLSGEGKMGRKKGIW